jgi:signal transduction histidine kinase
MVKMPAAEEQHFILSSLPPSLTQKRLAAGVVIGLLIAFVIMAVPYSAAEPRRIEAFIPAYATALFLTDLMTSVLLFAQFSILRSRALLAIASGYLFTALIVVPWLLTFPGVFTAGGLLGAGLQTTNWLYILWHAGFPMFVVAYALSKDTVPAIPLRPGSASVALFASVAMTVAAVCAVTVLVTAGQSLLPRTMVDLAHFSTLRLYLAVGQVLVCLAALLVLWVRRRSVLDLWLMVVLCAYAVEIALIVFPVPVRYSAGWYAGRVCGLLSGSLVLFVLLHEITMLYAQALRTMLAQMREREARLMTGEAVSASIAHEVRQPLSAMITNANASLRWLDRGEPDLDEAKAAMARVVADGHRASAVIENIRALFRKDARSWISLDVNNLIQDALTLMRGELETHRIAVQVARNEALPRIRGDQVQLQLVLVNLLTNAIDSMASREAERELWVKSQVHDFGAVMVSVEDTGSGIEPSTVERIFDPLFTTKANGMGMGLAICRSIIEAHQGRLWVTAKLPRGSIFHFTVPALPGDASSPRGGITHNPLIDAGRGI